MTTPIGLLLTLTKVTVAAALPFGQISWDNPPRAKQSYVRGFNQSFSLPLTTVAPPSLQRDWPVPRGARRSVELINEYSSGFQLPLTTVRPPFLQGDWPNPRGRRSNPDWVKGSPYSLITVVGAPFAQTDWPNPRGRVAYDRYKHEDHVTFLDDPALQRWDNPNPQRRIDRRQDWVASSPYALTSVVVAGTPFFQTEWPVPRGRVAYGRYQYEDFSRTFDIPAPQRWDSPLPPRGRKPVVADWVKSTPYTLTTVVVVGTPFVQTDWPNPRGRVAYDRYKHEDFFRVFDVPAPQRWDSPLPPRGRKPVVADWVKSTPYTLAFVPFVQPPLNQFDWPNPRGRKPVVVSWQRSFPLPLTTHSPRIAQRDWPNPIIRRGSLYAGIETLSVVVDRPDPRQRDWPNPRGRQPLNRGFTVSFNLPLTTVRGFNQFDWPVPKGAAPTHLRTWLERGLARFEAPPVAVFQQAVSATITTTFTVHVCGWSTELQEAEGVSIASEQGQIWTVQAEEDDEFEEQDPACGPGS